MNRFKDIAVRFIKGVIIGISAILPGASGGLLAVALGIYRSAISAVTSLFRNFKTSFLYLLPIGIGGLIGLFGCGKAVEFFMTNHRQPIMWFLIGMVLGGVPAILKDAHREKGFKPAYLAALAVGVIMLGSIAVAQNALGSGEPLPFNIWTAALSGALVGIGVVIPGISTSFILIYFGLYDPFLYAFTHFDITLLFFAGLGCLIVILALINIVKKLFDSYASYAYYGALGLLAASVVLNFPGFGAGFDMLLDIVLLIAGFTASYFICKIKPDEA